MQTTGSDCPDAECPNERNGDLNSVAGKAKVEKANKKSLGGCSYKPNVLLYENGYYMYPLQSVGPISFFLLSSPSGIPSMTLVK